MDVERLKEYIVDNNCISDLLNDIGCHHIQWHSGGYYTAGNPDGDNPSAIIVRNNEWLSCIDYTRSIVNTERSTDLIDLIAYFKELSFWNTLQYICDFLSLDYYHDFDEDVPESLLITDMIFGMSIDSEVEKEKPLKPIPKSILSYYKPYLNDMFAQDGIGYVTQQEFGIGYDECTNRITIPIYSELGDLVGVKGRLFKDNLEENEMKYIYLEPCARSKILFGLNKTLPYIKRLGRVYVLESEKAVMQLWDYGVCNSVATGGKQITKQQIEMLTRLGVDIVLCLDKDVEQEEIDKLMDRFIQGVPVKYMIDKDNQLKDKQAPTDNMDAWEYLVRHNIYDR